ncbi:MAG: FtsX-like permease family protein [Bacteroidetes bacterium]|nr:FtsX-like permease family protein [Bacteroidota bacterium]
MNFSFYIAKRYLVSKKSHNIINIISGISVAGITIGTMALIIILSVFNGFEGLVISLFNNFNPDLVITPSEGKTIKLSQFPSAEIKILDGVDFFMEVIEENVLIQSGDKQHFANIKGVPEHYTDMSGLDSCMVDGEFKLKQGGLNYAIIGSGVAYFLDFRIKLEEEAISILAPRKSKGFNLNPEQDFSRQNILVSGVFMVEQNFDSKYIFAPFTFVKEILEYDDEISYLEIGLGEGANSDQVQSKIKSLLGPDFKVKNRFEQQELLYKIMKSEKWAIFLILTFILLIATFNVIGSLSMLILDKKKDIAVLQSMGANNQLIRRIFLFEGSLISMIGALSGLILGTLICVMQMQFGLVGLGDANGAFIVNSYPVILQWTDFVYVFFTVFIIGILATWIPTRRISQQYLNIKLG